MKRTISGLLILIFLLSALTGCGDSSASETESSVSALSEVSENTAEVSGSSETAVDTEFFTDRDYRTDYDAESSVHIQMNEDSVSADSDSVQISGTTITITEEGTYLLSGTLTDGMIVVNAPDTAKIQLVFNGVNLNSASSAPLYILEADKVFVTLADGTENTLSNGGTFTPIDENNIDGAVYSKQDLTFNGSGSLTITSPAGHGIICNDDLVITGGTYSVTSASHGLKANDSVRITGETSITVDAGKDGIHAENSDDASLGFVYINSGTFDIQSEGDGVSAGSSMQIEDGSFQILAGGGSGNGEQHSSDSWGGFRGGKGSRQLETTAETTTEEDSTSMKGLKAAGDLLITGGSFTIDSADDSVHSNTVITVNAGDFTISSGNDAFHADDTLTVTGGTMAISESYEGFEALYVDIQGGEITLTATDDGLNAAGGTDSSGISGGRDAMFGKGGSMASSNGSITISGGNITINASGDGIDANGSVTISGGNITVSGPTQGDTSILDYDTTGTITGGTFIGTGATNMAQTFSDSQQGVVAVSSGGQPAGTTITLTDQSGNTLITYTPELDFDLIILSSPDLVSGETYTVTVGTASGEFTAS